MEILNGTTEFSLGENDGLFCVVFSEFKSVRIGYVGKRKYIGCGWEVDREVGDVCLSVGDTAARDGKR